jgi:23S rRNA-/tRNA-specific pseudouridylate synthase
VADDVADKTLTSTATPCSYPPHLRMRRVAGRITINGAHVVATTIVRDNDLIRNTAHRHEPPVLAAELEIVHEDDAVVAVDKPASMPVHTCGRYRYNTVQSILDRELGRPGLLPCHRLDRLTSGVLIFAKNKASAKHMQSQIQGHHLQKVYVCRVRGEFPEGVTMCAAPIKVVCHKLGVCSVDFDGACPAPVDS